MYTRAHTGEGKQVGGGLSWGRHGNPAVRDTGAGCSFIDRQVYDLGVVAVRIYASIRAVCLSIWRSLMMRHR